MKQSRFIELLNLYVDHQIGSAEAAELEAEILSNPERRKMYRDYCRMQRACGLLFDHEQKHAPASFALEKSLQEIERKIGNFPARRKTPWGTYSAAFAGVTAMAACLTVVLLRPGSVSPTNPTSVASVPSFNPPAQFVAQTSAPVIQTATLNPRGAAFQPVFASQNLTVGRDEVASTDRGGTEWLQQVQLPPVQSVVVDDTAFETKPTLQQDNRVFRSIRPIQGNVEFTAFQFQR